MSDVEYGVGFDKLRMRDVGRVGGKNASLGEMISELAHRDVRVPGGFATTASAYRDFLAQNGLEKRIEDALLGLDIEDVKALAKTGAQIRGWIVEQALPPRLAQAITQAYQPMLEAAGAEVSVAVRSSATAEDLPDASFAGQQETFLNIHGIDNVLHAVKEVFASLYNDRAISYRVHPGYIHSDVALSAGVQRMVRSDLGAAGVMFTIDTESGVRPGGIHHLGLRAGRDRGARSGQSRRILRLQAGAEAGQEIHHPPQPRHESAAHDLHRRARGREIGADP